MKSARSSRFSLLSCPLVRPALYAAIATLAACASPPSHFYTLGSGSSTTDSTTQSTASPAFLIEVPTVAVPAQVARAQFVVQAGDARVDVLEQQRWASPPADEIRRALSGDLAARLGTFDVYGTPYPNAIPVYRVSVNVQRFESWPGSHALIDAVWSVRAVTSQALLTCRTLAQVSVGAGFPALVDGHRQAVAKMADEIAAAVRTLGHNDTALSAANAACAAGNDPPSVSLESKR
ncbi:MAG TPA: PqiC family protein [Trinickia sp.]|nr:PqiC family protein [Trinickia sp.]